MEKRKIKKLARILVNYSCGIKKGNWVFLVTNSLEAKPLYDEIRKLIFKKGGNVSDHFGYEIHESPILCDDVFLKNARRPQIKEFPQFRLDELRVMDVYLRIKAGQDPQKYKGIKPWKISLRSETVSPMFKERLKKRWVITMFPTSAYAKQLKIPLSELEKIVSQAFFLNKNNPIIEWKGFSLEQEKLIKKFQGVDRVDVKGKRTALSMSIKGRKFVSCDGTEWDMPGGEVFTCPLEDSVEGKIYFENPVFLYGQEIRGLVFEFKKGRIIKVSADKGVKIVQNLIKIDEGARRLGELGIGTHPQIKRITGEFLLDEKVGGTIHLGLGNATPATGGRNKSSIHRDFVFDLRKGGQITMDEKQVVWKEDRWHLN